MNYYERIQRAIDFIESRLETEIALEEVARAAFMSQANLYRLFFALTGCTVKEYIRKRQLSLAALALAGERSTVLEIAVQYGFDSHESFGRAFAKTIGVTPGAFKKGRLSYHFERMNVLDKYYDVQDPGLLAKYPEIKVLRELEPVRVAYCRYYGAAPETGAWDGLSAWLRQSGLGVERDRLRFFGFNNPNPAPGRIEYGYEIWVTIPETLNVTDQAVKWKRFDGGLYAVTGTKCGGEGLPAVWKRMMAWLKDSKYTLGRHQWLEEHLGFDEQFRHNGSIDLYLPIAPKADPVG